MADETGSAGMAGSGKFGARADVLRGALTWNYFYVLFGFALSIEGTFIQMLPVPFPWNIVMFLGTGWITYRLVFHNGRCQDELIKWKNAIENTPR
jgi:hypothetical protein